MKLSDRAIADRAEDILGRWGIAKAIYDLIANTHTDSALRVGIYGSWGEGKTSVLRFIESLCRKANIPTWGHSSPPFSRGLADGRGSMRDCAPAWPDGRTGSGSPAASGASAARTVNVLPGWR